MNNYIFEIENLSKKFDGFLLDSVSFKMKKGFIMGLVGKNGAGKTTIIKLILQLLKKDKGRIKIFGENIYYNNFNFKEDIGVVFDEIFFSGDWNLAEVESAISPFYKKWNSKKYWTLLNDFNLKPNKRIKELSKGMKMKLMLAVALSHDAKLLILDEPTSGLDPVARDELLDILLNYIEDENNGILFSSHITSDLDKIADYLTIMNNGQVFYTGTKEELYDKYFVVKGGLDSLTKELEHKAIGVQKNRVGFKALLKIENMKCVTKDMIIEKTNIDEILIFINSKEKAFEGEQNEYN